MNITIEQVSKRYGSVQSLQPTDLELEHGRFTTLLGPSGSGKTTLLRLVAGLETPDTGTIRFGDQIVFDANRGIRVASEKRGLGMVFQDFALWPHMTVFENVAYGLKAKRRTDGLQDKVQKAIGMVRLTGKERRYPHELSGGEQQRVSFARAIAVEPQLILLDEPLSALDAILRDEMRHELTELVQTLGLTALYVTHDQLEAMSMSDRILVMQGGRVLQAGSPEDVYRNPQHPFVARFVGKTNWFDDGTRAIRPECIRLNRLTVDDRELTARIERVSYVGDRFEVYVHAGQQDLWMLYHPTRLNVGEHTTLYMSAEDIKPINQGGNIHV